jgi:hypothetical protein
MTQTTATDRLEELEREMARKAAYDKQMEQRMINAAQGMMNSNMGTSMGLGAQNAAQGSVWPTLTTNTVSGTIHSGPLVSKQSLQNPRREKRVRMDVAIEQAKNGYVLTFGNEYGESMESHIAVTFEDINTIINSELASRLLDKAE